MRRSGTLGYLTLLFLESCRCEQKRKPRKAVEVMRITNTVFLLYSLRGVEVETRAQGWAISHDRQLSSCKVVKVNPIWESRNFNVLTSNV